MSVEAGKNVATEATGAADEAAGQNTADEAKQEKVYTQTDVDNLIAMQKAKIPDEAEWKAFQDWKTSQSETKGAKQMGQTQADKATEADNTSELRKELETLKTENARYKNRDEVLKLGVSPEFADFAAFSIEQARSEKQSFADAADEWIKKNEQYKQSQAQAQGLRQGNSTTELSGVEESFYALNPKLRPKK